VAVFEDEHVENFLPLTYTRAVFELRSGAFTPIQRIEKRFPESKLLLFARSYLHPVLRCRFPFPINDTEAIDDEVLIINGALHVNKQTLKLIEKKVNENVAVTLKDRLALARLKKTVAKKHGDFLLNPTAQKIRKLLKECRVLRAENLPLTRYPWDLVDANSKFLKDDFALLTNRKGEGELDARVAIYGEKSDVHISEGAFTEPYVILDAREGPVYVGENTVLQSGSRISGPAYIGANTIIASAQVREGCSIGDVCRIGGEIEQTTVHGFTNKHHLGYIGHSYIGEWVNIGAATTNSDLKNTYGTVKIRIKERLVDTERTKVGCFMGDHAKTSIGTQIYTGLKIGVAAHVHGFVTQDVPSFTVWAKSLGAQPVELFLKSVVETQKRVFARRGVKQTKEDVELLKKILTITSQERRKAGVLKKKFEL